MAQGVLKGTGGTSAGDALKEVQQERDRLLRELNTLRPKLSTAEMSLASATAMVQRLEADLQQHKFLLGETQGKADRFRGELEGFKAECTGLRMQLEDATARSEHAIATLREERDLLHDELERLRNALQAASAEMSVGMQAVAKLSNIDARTVSSQVGSLLRISTCAKKCILAVSGCGQALEIRCQNYMMIDMIYTVRFFTFTVFCLHDVCIIYTLALSFLCLRDIYTVEALMSDHVAP